MRNLSPLGAIHSPIDAGRDPSAYVCDFAALGLPDHSPFAILSRPRTIPNAAAKPARKRGPKPSAAQRTIASLRDLPGPARFCTDIMTRAESDRTLAIQGRGLS
jgi:hypothetical protein